MSDSEDYEALRLKNIAERNAFVSVLIIYLSLFTLYAKPLSCLQTFELCIYSIEKCEHVLFLKYVQKIVLFFIYQIIFY